ncbi:hypothetical protein ACFRFH_12530 [Leifsonia sp. NPDC056824]|uniref:hypothetical protein n=1 Tax=Leifsonia sp. NPDC056824 TaxID=3345953 RepID=UPI0036AF9F55
MSDSQPPRTPWYHENLWSNILGGVATALVLGVLYWAFGVVSAAKLPVWVYVFVVGLVVLVVSMLIPLWRRAIWGNVGRGLKWIWSWHPVSTRRFRAARKADYEYLDKLFADNFASWVRKVIKDDKQAEERMKEIIAPVVEQRMRNLQAIRDEAAAVSDPGLAPVPRPVPRWSVEVVRDGVNEFVLVNHVPRSGAREVRIEGDDDFTITSAGQWEDLSGEARGEFTGTFTRNAMQVGVKFFITWFDDNGLTKTAVVFVSAPEIGLAAPF